jgi:DNA-binding NarL/FixJ family response regulator
MRIVILTTFERDESVLSALQAGANGFLSKGVGPHELVAGINGVAAGGGALSSAAAAAVIDHVADQPAKTRDTEIAARFVSLTPREFDVVISVAMGLDNNEIAAKLFVSPYTVRTHAQRAMAKVGARDRAQLVAFTYRAGIVE